MSTTMQTISIARLPQFIAFNTVLLNNVVFIWGGMGMAKTQLIRYLAEQHNAHYIPLHVSSYESVDFRGLPEREGDMTKWLMPSTIPFIGNTAFDHIPDDQMIWLHLDEMNANLMAMLYQLVDERRVNEHVLRPNVRIIASGNREGDKGITMRMPLPLANRMVHVEVVPELDFFCEWAAGAGISPLIIAYLQFKKVEGEHYMFDPSKPEKVVATWRTWEKAARAYAARDQADEDIVRATMAGCVGEGPTVGFWAFATVYQNIAQLVPDIIAGKKVTIPDQADVKYAITVALSGEMGKKTAKNIYAFLKTLEPEMMVLAWSLALKRDSSLYHVPEFVAYAKDYNAIFSPTK